MGVKPTKKMTEAMTTPTRLETSVSMTNPAADMSIPAAMRPDGFPSWNLEHAGVMETSVMLYLDEHLVKFDLVPKHSPADFPPYDIYPVNPARIPSTGALSSGQTATAEKGKYMLDEYVETISAALRKEFAL